MNYQAAPQEINKVILRSSWISFLGSIFVLSIKFAAYFQTHSAAVLSDALESIVNVIAAFAALMIMRKVTEPADEQHPYGHGKLEYFSSAFEGGLIAFAALAIIHTAIQALLAGTTLNKLDEGMGIMFVASAINLSLALYLLGVGKKHKTEALLASGKHIMSDVVTSVGVIVGLLLVKLTKLNWIDPIFAALVALHLLKEGYSIVRRSIGGLIDEMEEGSLKEICKSLTDHRIPGVIDIHHLKLIRSGRFHHIDAHLVIPEHWDVLKAHEVIHDYEQAVVYSYSYDGEIAFHFDPCKKAYCQSCDLQNCPIRTKDFVAYREIIPSKVIKGPSYND